MIRGKLFVEAEGVESRVKMVLVVLVIEDCLEID